MCGEAAQEKRFNLSLRFNEDALKIRAALQS